MEQNAALVPKEDSNKMLAGIAYFLGVLGIIFAFMDQGKEDPWLRFHAWQSCFFGLVMAIAGSLLSWTIIVPLSLFVMWIIYLIKAFKGEYFEIPVIGKLAKDQAKI